jgi:hypothetical protein
VQGVADRNQYNHQNPADQIAGHSWIISQRWLK